MKYFKNIKKIILLAYVLVIFLLNNTVYATESIDGKNYEWQIIDNKKYYIDNMSGSIKTGWEYIDGKWYYLDEENGAMKTGWKYVDSKWYYLDEENGAMRTGWEYVDGKWYYLDKENGAMRTGWKYINSKWYYLSKSGAMKTGWEYINSKWYYLSKSGAMKTGWEYINGKWYYLDKQSGQMRVGWLNIDDNYYFLNKNNGHLVYGNFEIDNKQYFTDKLGRAFLKNDVKVNDSKTIYAKTLSITNSVEDLPAIKSSSPQKYKIDRFEWLGVIYWNRNKFTYYSERVLPGGGLDIPGRITRNGFVTDKDGYIVLASNILVKKGTIIDTPFGAQGKVYDRCEACSLDWFDVYTR
ncbi:hypothetical protein ABGF26_04030 [Helcococcus ovis]|uniref:hypothetical protein n=1 Tax=Helcococcus ovis TaxID=72026 RepID=UPI0038BB50D1